MIAMLAEELVLGDVLLIVACAAIVIGAVVAAIVRKIKGKTSCGGDCGCCSGCSYCASKSADDLKTK